MEKEGSESQLDELGNMSRDCLVVKPSQEITFRYIKGRFQSDLTLTNKADEPVMFRIRTTASKNYLVVPTAGLIPPGEIKVIKIQMPKKENITERAEDKFLVQGFVCNSDEVTDDSKKVAEMFVRHTKSILPKALQNVKLKVHFDVDDELEAIIAEDNTGNSISQQSQLTGFNRMVYEEFEKIPSPEKRKIYLKTKVPGSFESIPMQKNELKRALKFSPESPNKDASNEDGREKESFFRLSPLIGQQHDSAPKKNGLSQFYSTEKKRSTPKDNEDNSIESIASHAQSQSSKPINLYKQKYQSLEKKYKQQKTLLAQFTEQKNAYQKEINILKLSSLKETSNEPPPKSTNPYGFELYHLLLISIAFLIFGSLWR